MCFAIRARDENATLHPALPQEASDDDELKAKSSAEQARPGMPDSVQRAIKQVETQLLARTGAPKATSATTATSPLKEQRQGAYRLERERERVPEGKRRL